MDSTFIQDRLAAVQNQIIAYETAIDKLVSGGVQQYTLDTGQSRQTVTRLELNFLQKHLDTLYNRYTTLESRLNGGGTIARPAW